MSVDPRVRDVRTLEGGAVLRPIRAEDDPLVARIIREVMTEFRAVGKGFSIEDPEVDHMSRAYSVAGAVYFVVEDSGKVVGGAGVGPLPQADPDVCELKKMYLRPGGRRRGLGRALLDHCLWAAGRLGYRRVYLETLTGMDAAQRLYEKRGFRPLPVPMGATGHTGCNRWYLREVEGTPRLDLG